MNREQRRKIVKAGVTAEELKRISTTEGLNATRQAVTSYSAAVAMVLHDKLRFGKSKVQTTLRQIEELFASVNGNFLSVEDIKQTVKNDLDIDIR